MDTPKIVLKYNNAGKNDPCAICEDRTDPVVGIECFLENTNEPVCDQCAEKYAPELKLARDILQEEVNEQRFTNLFKEQAKVMFAN